jgi:7,8-dihydropterin-6-yl-methyl-4-(beta-D-ribofuranosyl)aminobenzene 5'-phosphate synthase
MKITVLVEDTSSFKEYEKERGLSFYIATENHKILFDCGLGSKFSKNADKMAIDLSSVDIAFISHGHLDHGRGLYDFIRVNKSAPIYIQTTTFGRYYGKKNDKLYYAGLNQKLLTNPRLTFINGSTKIDNELQIISKVPPIKEIKNLFMKVNANYLPDTFEHEQSLVISENNKQVLISGCSHCGIDRILSKAIEICGKIDFVLGGFHLIQYDFDRIDDLVEIDTLAKNLMARDSMYYTCHCTSTRGYSYLKSSMGDRLGYLSTGNTIWL